MRRRARPNLRAEASVTSGECEERAPPAQAANPHPDDTHTPAGHPPPGRAQPRRPRGGDRMVRVESVRPKGVTSGGCEKVLSQQDERVQMSRADE